MSVQTTLHFHIRKKCSFYGSKENTPKQDFTNAKLRATPKKTPYTPPTTSGKIFTFSSSSESDSDSDSDGENVSRAKTTVNDTPKRAKKISKDSEDENGSTPPKRKKSEKVSPLTPSTLLDRLNLTASPENGERMSRKRLFGSGKYQSARKALHSSAPANLPGREAQLAELRSFLSDHLDSERSGSLYVSGPPGTGKTACLSKIILRPEFKSAFKTVYVNCTAMKSAGTIYAKIIQELGIPSPKSAKSGKTVIEKYLSSSHKMILLILDEIDQLESKRQSVLYSIFEWPSRPNSKLLLVGIANALDLTDRILPRLQARCELKPKLMHFAPYDKRQIANIITERLKEANVSDIFTGMALQLLAGKVAAISGDVRRALDISRRVVELAESRKSSQVLQPTIDNESNCASTKKQDPPPPPPPADEKPVDLKEVVTVLNTVYGASQNIDNEESTFPLQQKLLLCSLMLILNKGRNKDVTIGKLHEVYKKVCRKRSIHAVDVSEFVGLCSLIETRGVLRVVGKKEPRLSKVNLQWDQEELATALQDKQMMCEIINDASCL